MDREGLRTLTRGSDTNCLLRNSGIELTSCWMRRLQETSGNIRKPQVCWKITKTKTNQGTRMQSRNLILNYTSIDPKQQQRMFPPRSCAIQNSWNCLAHSYLLFYSFITSTVQIRGNKRNAPTHPGIHTEWRSLIFKRVQNWYKLFSLENNSASTSPWNRTLFLRKEEERRRETSTGTPARTKRNQEIHDETEPLSWKKREEGRQAPEPSRNQEEPVNHDGTEAFSWEKKEERRRETSTGTPAGTRRNQQIMMEQNPFPEERKKREEGRQAPEPKKREGETSTGTPAGTKRNQQIMMEQNQEERRRETSTGTKEERRRETSTRTPAGTRKNQQIMMEQNPFQVERKKREEGRQAPEPKKREERRQTPESSRNQEEPANHDGTEPLSWGKKEERQFHRLVIRGREEWKIVPGETTLRTTPQRTWRNRERFFKPSGKPTKLLKITIFHK